MSQHTSPGRMTYTKQVPSGLCCGVGSGRSPGPQQTNCLGIRVAHRSGRLLLYFAKSSPEIPHRLARDPQPSPETTSTALQVSLIRRERPSRRDTEKVPFAEEVALVRVPLERRVLLEMKGTSRVTWRSFGVEVSALREASRHDELLQVFTAS